LSIGLLNYEPNPAWPPRATTACLGVSSSIDALQSRPREPHEFGDRLGRYEVVSPLGAGGVGEVYRARDTELQRDVAFKILPEELSSDADRLRRFEREAKATAALSHPNVLTVFDVGHEGGRTYLVLEMLEGSTLADVMKNGALRTREALDYAGQVARGLAAAHARGIVHRDLKRPTSS
jgi:serine/threonine protein kinase